MNKPVLLALPLLCPGDRGRQRETRQDNARQMETEGDKRYRVSLLFYEHACRRFGAQGSSASMTTYDFSKTMVENGMQCTLIILIVQERDREKIFQSR